MKYDGKNRYSNGFREGKQKVIDKPVVN